MLSNNNREANVDEDEIKSFGDINYFGNIDSKTFSEVF